MQINPTLLYGLLEGLLVSEGPFPNLEETANILTPHLSQIGLVILLISTGRSHTLCIYPITT